MLNEAPAAAGDADSKSMLVASKTMEKAYGKTRVQLECEAGHFLDIGVRSRSPTRRS